MIGRRGFILVALALVPALCASCRKVSDGDGEANDNDHQIAREHISQDNVVDVFLFSLDGKSVSKIDESDLPATIEALANLDSEASEDPAEVPEGGASGGRERMFFVVLESSTTLTVGTDGSCAIYDSIPYESNYDACQQISDLYSRLIETTSS